MTELYSPGSAADRSDAAVDEPEVLGDPDKADAPDASAPITSIQDKMAELRAMETCLGALIPLSENAKLRAVTWLVESLQIDGVRTGAAETAPLSRNGDGASSGHAPARDALSPREFMSLKKPSNQAEKIACLAFYLAHYRDTSRFKSQDIADLNVEAAGQKFGNLSRDIDNTEKRNGYIVGAGPGLRQLNSRGEEVVEALPDKNAVAAVLKEDPFRGKRAVGGKKAGPSKEDEQ